MPILIPRLCSQRWGVFALVRTVGMADARRRCERRDARCLVPTVLAGIGLLLASFVKRVTAFVRAIRMANACGRREARDGRRLVSAVLAVERRRLLRLRKGKRRQADNCQYRDGSSNHCVNNLVLLILSHKGLKDFDFFVIFVAQNNLIATLST